MRRLLIDANIYLEFFRFSNDDLEELRKLAELIRAQEIQLYVNEQLRDEFLRNRDKVLAHAIKTVADTKVPASFPQVLRNYERFKMLTAARNTLVTEIDNLLSRAREDALSMNLPADRLLSDILFSPMATDFPVTPEVIERAKARFDRGNPPGKDRSYGDAITWETLLAGHPAGEPLDIVTADSDYLSPLRSDLLADYLRLEWHEAKLSQVTVYPSLSAFLKQHYPDIKLSTEVASELAVLRLEDSASFASTHGAIEQLRSIPDFSSNQVERLITCALSNNQVSMILGDDDVREFFSRLLHTFGDVVTDQSLVDALRFDLAAVVDG